MLKRSVGFAGGLLLWAGGLCAQAGPAERVPITDADELAALGMPRDARNVYRWSRASEGASKVAAAVQSPDTWGTATGFTSVSAMDLAREHYSGLIREPDRSYCPPGFGGSAAAQEALAELQLPDGAALEYLGVWGYDEEPDYALTVRLFEFCQAVGYNPPTTTLIGSLDSIGAAGDTYDVTPLNNYPVSNQNCGYSVRVIFVPGTVLCRSDKIQFRKLTVLWHRRVSPAPATATYADVPPGHPYFQFIEALAKSGITGGCGGGNFCPDNPLTRGQMAVFLAKGLGMGWQ